MANRFPLIVNTTSGNSVQELPSGDFLDLSNSGISNSGNIAVSGIVSATGNITGNYILGNGSQLSGIIASVANISSGTSNVTVVSSGGNVTVGVGGTGNVAVFATTGVYVTGVVSATGNITGGNLSGTNLTGTLATAAQTNITSVGTLSSLSVTGNVVANVVQANTFIGNITGNLAAPGADKEVLFNDGGVTNAVSGMQFNKTGNVLSVTGNVISGGSFAGSGVGLTETMVNRGGDTTNWNVLLQMGTYTVNRTSWGGVTGPPLDSQVYVGLLEVKNSNVVGNVAVTQTYYPGTIDNFDNVKIQFVRNYWGGSWTPWIKMTNNDQQIDGGTF